MIDLSQESEEDIIPLKRRRKKSNTKTKFLKCDKVFGNYPSSRKNSQNSLNLTNSSTLSLKSSKQNNKSTISSDTHANNKQIGSLKTSSPNTIIFPSKRKKSDIQFIQPRTFCPVCNINFVYLYGVTPQAHINDCLDDNPDFEKGYCSGDSTSLSNDQHDVLLNQESELDNENVKDAPKITINFNLGVTIEETTHQPVTVAKTQNSMKTQKATENLHFEKRIAAAKNVISGTPKKMTQTFINNFFSKKPKSKMDTEDHFRNFNLRNKQTMTAEVKPPKQKHRGCNDKRRECPFYKKIPGTGFTVDAFRYGEIEGCTGYFLSHFHSDHYGGLKKDFKQTIYCSQITANLVISQIKVLPQYIQVLPTNQAINIQGVEVTLIDANHCPGAVMFLMDLPNGNRILHVGDFRAHPDMLKNSSLRAKPVHTLYLDTTYCDSKYIFPHQHDVIKFVTQKVREALKENANTLIACGTYGIGKEKVFKSIAADQNLKIGVSKAKMSLLKCLDDQDLEERLTLDYSESQLHLVPMGKMSCKYLHEYLDKYRKGGYDHLLAFKPTGWTYNDNLNSVDDIKPICMNNITLFCVPYSEHSSFKELKIFVSELCPKNIIPTVNISRKESRDQMKSYFEEWLSSSENTLN